MADADTDRVGSNGLARPTLGDGRYEIVAGIGRGGFAMTYAAFDHRLHRRVAVKELFAPQATRVGSALVLPGPDVHNWELAKARFVKEARVLARFTHPGIVRVYEVFEENNTAYMVMELLGGRSLIDVMKSRQSVFTESEVLDVAARVGAALRPVHAAGVLHRDLNPSNIMLSEHGRIVVIDFGLARDFEPERTIDMTQIVTPGYAPLEQYHGEARFGPATDIYGLAATLYRLSTGRIPPVAIERDASIPLEAPNRLNPAISKQLSDAILDGLELEASHRPADVDAFLARLGIRRLPEDPCSVLYGSVGAESEVLRSLDHHASFNHVGIDGRDDVTEAGVAVVGGPPNHRDDETVIVGVDSGRGVATATDIVDGDRTRIAGDSLESDQESSDGFFVESDEPLAAGGSYKKVTMALALVAISAGIGAPVLALGAMVLVVLPVLGTIGDMAVRSARFKEAEVDAPRRRTAPSAVVAPGRFLRNLVVSVVKCSPILGVSAVLLGLWYLADQTSLSGGALDVVLQVIGAASVAAIVAANGTGSSSFRTGLGVERIAEWIAPGGRLNLRVFVGWVLVVVVVCLALWLDPDPFPLR